VLVCFDWKRIRIWKQDIEYFHTSFTGIASINLKHQIIQIFNIFHPAAGIQVTLLLICQTFNAIKLNSLHEFQQLRLIITHVKGQELLFLHLPLFFRCWFCFHISLRNHLLVNYFVNNLGRIFLYWHLWNVRSLLLWRCFGQIVSKRRLNVIILFWILNVTFAIYKYVSLLGL